MHYLMNFTASEKEKHTVLKTPNKSVIQTFSLEPEQETWISQLWQDTILLLQSTPPNGKLFTETVLYILDHEKNWVNWKNESCPPFEKTPLLASESLTDIAQKRVKLSIPAATIKNAVGTRTLTKLWDLGKEDKDFFSEFSNKRTAPPLLEYLDQIGDIKAKISSADPEEVETAQSKRWRALRMASKQYLCCFGRIGNGDLTTLKKEVLNEIKKANEVPKPSDHGKHSGDNVKQVEPQKPDDTKQVEAEKSDNTKQVEAEKSNDTKQVEAEKSNDTKQVETEKSDDSKNVPNATTETPQESIASASSEPLEQNIPADTTNSPEVAVVTEAVTKAVDVSSENTQVEPTSPEPNPPVSDPPKSPTIVSPSDDSVKNEDNSPSQAEV
ncbi:hypothetical protein K7432_013874 [Basidiobolus ranarum]|uniref:Uncharacterized protein n=1 Tax=Basidiobolus ranarum TaxID=34480 RepID=A0ABR2VQ79_9FUNG